MGNATAINMEAWDRDFRMNVTSMVLMSRRAISEVRKQGRGSIVNMSTVSGRKHTRNPIDPGGGGAESTGFDNNHSARWKPESAISNHKRCAIIHMARATAAHNGQENIRVNYVAPGMVYAPMARVCGMTDEMRRARISPNFMKIDGIAWDVGYGKLPTCDTLKAVIR